MARGSSVPVAAPVHMNFCIEKCIFQKCIFRKCIFRICIFRKFCKFLAGSFSAVSKRNFARKYAFDSIFKLYKICILLHRCNLTIFAKSRFEKTAIFVKIQQKKLQMSQNLQNFVKFQKFQLENLVDFEKCCRTHIYLQKSEPIQPKTSNVLPKFCQPTLSDVAGLELVLGSLLADAGRRVRDRARRPPRRDGSAVPGRPRPRVLRRASGSGAAAGPKTSF